MQRTGAILFFLVLALFAAPISTQAAAQLPQGPTPTTGCKECGGTGRTPCPKHPKNEAAHEDEVEFCSFVADCEVCGGAGWVNCKKCGGTEDSRNKLQAKRDLVARQMRLPGAMLSFELHAGEPAADARAGLADLGAWQSGNERKIDE